MKLEDARAELVAFIENMYDGQTALRLADAYAGATLKAATQLNSAQRKRIMKRLDAIRQRGT